MRIGVESVLFVQLTGSNAGAMLRENEGEYDLRLSSDNAFAEFSAGVPDELPTPHGGWTRQLPIAAYDGADPVGPHSLALRYMGPASARRNYDFRQQGTAPYPLWAPVRTYPDGATRADLTNDVAIVVKDVAGNFHARWVREPEIPTLPDGLRRAIATQKKGVYRVPSTTAAPSPRVAEIISALRQHHNVLLYGPPGTGKTHLMAEVRRHFAGAPVQLDTAAETGALSTGAREVFSLWATFHQSYSYEDFIVGLRPEPLDSGGFQLKPSPGVLLELAEWARAAGRESLLIIDEVNRGNVSRIFGEFITLMEPDKRLGADGSRTETTLSLRLPFIGGDADVTVTLPDGSEATVPMPFTLPRPIFTLATMNSVDKSVAPLDAALRRRFHVVDLSPRLDTFWSDLRLPDDRLDKATVARAATTTTEVRRLALALLRLLNDRITTFLGPDFAFGEWFLTPLVPDPSAVADMTPDEARAALATIWRTRLMPQLEDYFVGRADQLSLVLGSPTTSSALVVNNPPAEFAEAGATRSLRGNPAATDEEIVAFLLSLVRPTLPDAPAAQDAGAETRAAEDSAAG